MMRAPLWYFGGKGNMVKKLLPLMPEHVTYVEPFGGGASLLFAKEPSKVEVYNDIDGRVVNFFRVLRDPQKRERFLEMARLTPYSRKEHDRACEMVSAYRYDDVERAWAYFVMMRQGFSGTMGKGGWSMSVTASHRGIAGAVSNWLSAIDNLPAVCDRLRKVQIECNDWRKVVEQYDRPTTFFYMDPPYVPSARKAGGYAHEMSHRDHEALVRALLRLEGKCLLSGYASEVYAPLEDAGWARKEWKTAAHAAGRTRKSKLQGKGSAMKHAGRTEVVWMNYEVGDVEEMS